MESSNITKEFAKEDPRTKTAMDALNSTPGHIYSLNCPVLDIVLGGGFPSGKVAEIFGWESTGKSTLALEFAFAFIDYWKVRDDENFLVLWVETESVFAKDRVELMAPGKLKHFVVAEVETVEDFHELVKKYLEKARKTGTKLFIVWDTLAAAETRAQKSTGSRTGGGMGEFPQLIRFMLRDLVRGLGETNSSLVLVNQIGKSFTPHTPDESPGGGAPKFFASIRMKTRRASDFMVVLPSGEEHKSGIITEVKTVKNKITSADQSVSITIIGERGIDKWDTTIRYLKEKKLVAIGGSWVNVVYPEKLFAKGDEKIDLDCLLDSKGEPTSSGWTSYKFQSMKKLQNHIDVVHPHLKDWIDYLIYDDRAKISPLLKVKLIEKIWDYENKFFGRVKTALTEEEKRVAEVQLIKIQEEEKKSFKKEIEELPDLDPVPEPKSKKKAK